MKQLTTLLFLFIFSISFGQNQTRDVLYLKNGSIIKGAITEMNPNTGIKIKTTDGSIFVYKMDEIVKTEKEEFVGKEISQEVSDNVDENAVKEYFENLFNKDKPSFKLIGASKLNGIKRQNGFSGSEIYEIEYEIIADTKETIYIGKSLYNIGDFNKSIIYSNEYSKGDERVEAGRRFVFQGSIYFQKTDNGWRAERFENKNYETKSSDYLSPNIAKQQMKEKAILLEKLKKDLDWKTEDSKPTEFQNQYYNSKDVPFFEYGNSKYFITTSGSYLGRNDLTAKIQNTFYDALKSTNRLSKSNKILFIESQNQANYTFIISKIDFQLKEYGYECEIFVSGRLKGVYNYPKQHPFEYKINLNSKGSKSYSSKMISKAEAFKLALYDFEKVVRGMAYKYGSIKIDFVRIETTKRGKVDKIVFVKPEKFINTKKMKFILLKKSDLQVEDGQFKLKGKIGDCIYKGEIVGNEIVCEVNGRKNKEAIGEYLTTDEKLIAISIY